MMIFNIFQVLALIYLVFTVVSTTLSFKLKINSYSFALAVLYFVLNIGAILLSNKNIGVYLGIGLFLSMLIEIVSSAKIPNIREYTLKEKIIILIINTLFWMPLISFLVFFFKNFDKINENIQQ